MNNFTQYFQFKSCFGKWRCWVFRIFFGENDINEVDNNVEYSRPLSAITIKNKQVSWFSFLYFGVKWYINSLKYSFWQYINYAQKLFLTTPAITMVKNLWILLVAIANQYPKTILI
jgi:hypothetical protein